MKEEEKIYFFHDWFILWIVIFFSEMK